MSGGGGEKILLLVICCSRNRGNGVSFDSFISLMASSNQSPFAPLAEVISWSVLLWLLWSALSYSSTDDQGEDVGEDVQRSSATAILGAGPLPAPLFARFDMIVGG